MSYGDPHVVESMLTSAQNQKLDSESSRPGQFPSRAPLAEAKAC